MLRRHLDGPEYIQGVAATLVLGNGLGQQMSPDESIHNQLRIMQPARPRLFPCRERWQVTQPQPRTRIGVLQPGEYP